MSSALGIGTVSHWPHREERERKGIHDASAEGKPGRTDAQEETKPVTLIFVIFLGQGRKHEALLGQRLQVALVNVALENDEQALLECQVLLTLCSTHRGRGPV